MAARKRVKRCKSDGCKSKLSLNNKSGLCMKCQKRVGISHPSHRLPGRHGPNEAVVPVMCEHPSCYRITHTNERTWTCPDHTPEPVPRRLTWRTYDERKARWESANAS